uniref:Thiamine transporter 2 n=1 Tax=Lygus hesperus TaxID=30085 RepID=A0A0A9WX16_LYGHE
MKMEKWKSLAFVICVYGVLKELRFLEPFMTRFFMTPPMNFTHYEVFVEIYPASVYSQWVCLVILFLVTDMLRYKPIIILNSLTGVFIYLMYSFSTSLTTMQIAYALSGLYYACELAYYTYIYAKVEREHYQEVTGYTQAGYLIGKSLSGVVAQSLVSLHVGLPILAYITLGTMCIATFWSISLPSADRSIYFNRTDSLDESLGFFHRTKTGFRILWNDFISAFKQRNVWKWIFWWTVADGIYLQVMQVIQLLWEEMHDKNEKDVLLNGVVDAVCTLSAAIGAYLFGKWRCDWNKYGNIAVAAFSMVLGNILVAMSFISSLPVSYVLYVLFFVFYNSAVTIARSQIALHIKPDSAGLTFGGTLLCALLYQSAIVGIMTQWFTLTIRAQFFIFGQMYVCVAFIYALQWLYFYIRNCRISKSYVDQQPSSTGPAEATNESIEVTAQP